MTSENSPTLFGAVLSAEGVRFRLWAPAATSIDLVICGGAIHAMEQIEQAFYEVFVPTIGAGTRYRYRINGEHLVADPASRFQPEDIEGPSEVIDPHAYTWQSTHWHGRPWIETVIYELHIGTFTPEGTYRAAIQRLDHLVDLGITAIEMMPLAEAPGTRNWGYDGVFLYAPERYYGRPEDLQAFVDAAHERGLMVFLDVVYNHFGPEGNYLNLYAPDFFTNQRQTPWGTAIHLTGPKQAPVRQFFIENALAWLEDYRFDGLRFDAAHELRDQANPAFLDTLVSTIRERIKPPRPVHLILENQDNNVRLLSAHPQTKPARYDAQWNDDLHHSLHVVATGEALDYYRDYAEDPIGKLMLAMSEGFVYQGDFSLVRNCRIGSPSAELPASCFVAFLQNHDQVGNRAFGERLGRLVRPRILTALVPLIFLTPMIPMLFMGEEWNASTPFLYFCDFEPKLAKSVFEGRCKDFAGFPDFSLQNNVCNIPDPGSLSTFAASHLCWEERSEPQHAAWLTLYREVLHIRRRELMPHLAGIPAHAGHATRLNPRAFTITYRLGHGSKLTILANLGDDPLVEIPCLPGRLLYATDDGVNTLLAPWSVRVHLDLREKLQ